MQDDPIRIPLRGSDRKTIKAYALVDPVDAHLAEYRWHLSGGYARRSTGTPKHGRSSVLLHRAVLGLGPDDRRKGDHISGDTLDNRRANLRVVTDAQNGQNQGTRRDSVSGYRGVFPCGRKWRAEVGCAGRRYYLGVFDTPEEAAAVVQAVRAVVMPFSVPERSALPGREIPDQVRRAA